MSFRYKPRLVGLFLTFVFCFTSPFINTVVAAPQILAVLATDVGVPFTCQDGLCKAELSTYCLQRDRPAPNLGTIYYPSAAEDFTLSVKMTSGETRDLPAAEHVTFVEARGFMAVSVFIEQAQLKRLGSLDATIRIGANASMLPAPVAGDPDPLSEKEIAYATGSLRQMGNDIVDNAPGARSARLLARVMNTLPARGAIAPGASNRLWQDAIGDDILGDTGMDLSRKAYDRCFRGSMAHAYGGVRRCLEFRHDEFIRNMNVDYWEQQPGS